ARAARRPASGAGRGTARRGGAGADTGRLRAGPGGAGADSVGPPGGSGAREDPAGGDGMIVQSRYEGRSAILNGLGQSRIGFATNQLREPAFFRGQLKDPLLFREAMGALHSVV